MFIGTCRMYETAKILRAAAGSNISSPNHRIHTADQMLKFILHIAGPPQYVPKTVHFLSDLAMEQIFEQDMSREDVLAGLQPVIDAFPDVEVFVIEICSTRETMTVGSSPHVVNTFTERDQARYADQITQQAAEGISVPVTKIQTAPQHSTETIRQMGRIKVALGGRPVIWVCHQRPPSNDPKYESLNVRRLKDADTLRRGADVLKDRFFDPSVIAAEMGQKAFFKQDGEDMDHLTPEAAERLAAEYNKLIKECVSQSGEA